MPNDPEKSTSQPFFEEKNTIVVQKLVIIQM